MEFRPIPRDVIMMNARGAHRGMVTRRASPHHDSHWLSTARHKDHHCNRPDCRHDSLRHRRKKMLETTYTLGHHASRQKRGREPINLPTPEEMGEPLLECLRACSKILLRSENEEDFASFLDYYGITNCSKEVGQHALLVYTLMAFDMEDFLMPKCLKHLSCYSENKEDAPFKIEKILFQNDNVVIMTGQIGKREVVAKWSGCRDIIEEYDTYQEAAKNGVRIPWMKKYMIMDDPVIVMERLQPLDHTDDPYELGTQILETLKVLHKNMGPHNDIKPDNIMKRRKDTSPTEDALSVSGLAEALGVSEDDVKKGLVAAVAKAGDAADMMKGGLRMALEKMGAGPAVDKAKVAVAKAVVAEKKAEIKAVVAEKKAEVKAALAKATHEEKAAAVKGLAAKAKDVAVTAAAKAKDVAVTAAAAATAAAKAPERKKKECEWEYILIDYGGVAQERMGSSWRRRIWTPNWCSQRPHVKEQMTSAKHDFLELMYTLKALQIWYQEEATVDVSTSETQHSFRGRLAACVKMIEKLSDNHEKNRLAVDDLIETLSPKVGN